MDEAEKQKMMSKWRKRILYYAIACALVAISSAVVSHYIESSPAWQADFTYSFDCCFYEPSYQLPDAIVALNAEDERPMQIGGIIEAVRIIIVMFFFIWLMAYLNLRQFLKFIKSIKKPTRKDIIFLATVIFLAVLISTYIVNYHISKAPDALKEKPKYWQKVKEKSFWWGKPGSHWREEIAPKRTKENFETNYAFKLYHEPYLWYLPYSLVIYVFFLFPGFIITIRAMLYDFLRIRTQLNVCRQALAGKIQPDCLSELGNRFHDTSFRLGIFIERYSWFVLWLTILALYELFLGKSTLAEEAQDWSVVSYIALALGLVLIGFPFFEYDSLFKEAKWRIIKANIAQGGDAEQISKNTSFLSDFDQYAPLVVVIRQNTASLAMILSPLVRALLPKLG